MTEFMVEISIIAGIMVGTRSTRRGAKGRSTPHQRPAPPAAVDVSVQLAALQSSVAAMQTAMSERLSRMEESVQDQREVVSAPVAREEISATATVPGHLSSESWSMPVMGVAASITGETGNQLDDHLTGSVRSKISEGSFVEFATLLPERSVPGESELQQLTVAADGVVGFAPREPVGGKVLSFQTWCQGFYIYATAYLRSFPGEAIALFKYVDTIRGLCHNGMSWAKYDNAFRKARANWPAKYKWDQVNSELFLAAQVTKNSFRQSLPARSSPFTQNRQGTVPTYIPAGFCRQFHARFGRRCSGDCHYSHKCPKCSQGSHPMYMCGQANVANSRPSVFNGRPKVAATAVAQRK